MNSFTRLSTAFGTLLLVLSIPSSNAATIYKWVDDKGVPQYTAMPPADHPYKKIKTYGSKSGTTSNSNKSTTSQTQQPEQSTKLPAASKKDPERCEIAKRNLETLKNNNRIKIQDENGEMRFLDQQEINEKRKESEQAVADSC